MKNIKAVLCAAVFSAVTALCAVNAHCMAIGSASETDIVTYIDGSPVESFNYLGYTYVVAEQLSEYGFDVEWNPGERALFITRRELAFTPFVYDFINTKKSGIILGRPLLNVYSTDINTYINGARVQSYNVYGRTIVNTADLSVFGTYTYDDSKRRVDIDILDCEIENCETKNNHSENNDYGKYIFDETQKGIFEGEELVYGKKITTVTTRYGDEITTEFGDFKSGKTIKHISSYKLSNDIFEYNLSSTQYTGADRNGIGYSAHLDGKSVAHCTASDDFKYGRYINYILPATDDGIEVRYLLGSGEVYLVGQKEENSYADAACVWEDDVEIYNAQTSPRSFKGELFKDGRSVYKGEIYFDRFKFQVGNSSNIQTKNITVLYAPAYSDADGVIYYYSDYPEQNRDYDCVYYRGNVVNGVAHGFGTIYESAPASYTGGCVNIYTTVGKPDYEVYERCDGVIYKGEFKDGLMDGSGIMYDAGFPASEGTWSAGVRNGFFREFQSYAENGSCLIYEGNIENDVRSGFGVEYKECGYAYCGGVYECFIGQWKDNSWYDGKWYGLDYDSASNSHIPYLLYEGEIRHDEPQYGTLYRCYNEETGEYEVKTGWFVNWIFQNE